MEMNHKWFYHKTKLQKPFQDENSLEIFFYKNEF